jgi:hypothetical protein
MLLDQIRSAAFPEPETEFRFAPPRRWRFDFLFPGKLAVEVEGGTWITGRHQTGKGFEQDCIKYAEAMLLGYRLLRVTGSMIKDGTALTLIQRALKAQHPMDPDALILQKLEEITDKLAALEKRMIQLAQGIAPNNKPAMAPGNMRRLRLPVKPDHSDR